MITFDSFLHEYKFCGVVKPSVSAILRDAGLTADFSMVNPDVLENARLRGEAIHKALEYDDMGILDEDECIYMWAVEAWRKWKKDNDIEIVAIESIVYNPTLEYCGTFDRKVITKTGQKIVDIKTSAKVSKSYALQVMAYCMTFDNPRELYGTIIRLNNGKMKEFDCNDLLPASEAMEIVTAAAKLYHFKHKKEE